MSKRKAAYASKLKRATHLLFYKRHMKPGVKGWELRKALGPDYLRVLKLLDDYLKTLDLKVETIFEGKQKIENPSPEQQDKARFLITLRGSLVPKEAKMVGWRVDDLSGLAVTIAFIISKRGKAPRNEVEDILR